MPPGYLRYDELTTRLREVAAAHPNLCRLEEIGRSREGRPIWAVTLTRFETGQPSDKPGLLVDANVHAGEVTGSAAALDLIERLLALAAGEHAPATPPAAASEVALLAEREAVERLLATRAVYVIPRIAVDGAEAYLAGPYSYRSSPVFYPHPEPRDGLRPADIDGDGRILLMRLPDPLGEWTVSPDDERLMLRCGPASGPGCRYRIYPEGLLSEEALRQGGPARPVSAGFGLDFNRNYPVHWQPEGRQPGAGPYPLSEPETRAVAAFIVGHPNLCAYVSLHTTGGVLLRPPSMGGSDKIDRGDLELFQRFGDACQQLTGYPCKSTYDAFATSPDVPLVKGADDWAYEHLGLFAFTLELWDLDGRAGARGYAQIGLKGLEALSLEELAKDERKRLEWIDREFGGEGFIRWRPFDHPQLGPVEIGGWDPKFMRQNPPLRLLPEECRRAFYTAVLEGLATPRLVIHRTEVEPLGRSRRVPESGRPFGIYRVRVQVANEGYLPTSGTRQAVELKQVEGVKVRLAFREGGRFVAGREEQDLGQLDGHGQLGATWWSMGSAVKNAAQAEWLVEAPEGSGAVVEARHARAGVAHAAIAL